MKGRIEDHSIRGGERMMGRKWKERRGERDNYWFTDMLYPPVGEIDTSVAIETNKDMSQDRGWAGAE